MNDNDELRHERNDVSHDSEGADHVGSRQLPIPNKTASETIFSAEELARRWNVSIRTVGRWRKRGLTSIYRRDRKQIGFPENAVLRFEQRYPNLVRHARRFSRMTEAEQQDILRRAKELLDGSLMTLTEVITILANEAQRSTATVRKLLKHSGLLDQLATRDVTNRAEEWLYREFCRGKTVSSLASQRGMSRSKATQAINRLRAARVGELQLDYMPAEAFTEPGAEQRIMKAPPPSPSPIRLPRKPADLPAYIASLYEVPLLTGEQETHLFRQYNFLKYQASQLRDRLDARHPSGRLLDAIEGLYNHAREVNRKLLLSNLRLVVAVSKKYVGVTGDLFEKISEGNLSLMRAVEKFDYTRGFKFSTYATWAIKKNFIRSFVTANRQADRFRTGHDELLDTTVARRTNPYIELEAQRHREQQVARILPALSERERDIIQSRFGLTPGIEPKTLQEVGRELGVSKERIRQIESRAMQKLRAAARLADLEDSMHDDQVSSQAN